MHLHAAHPHAHSAGVQFQFVFHADGPAEQGASDHRAKSLHGEHAVNRQPRQRRRIPRRGHCPHAHDRLLEFFHPFFRARADSDNRRARRFQERTAKKLFHFHSHDVQSLAVHCIGLGEDRDPMPNAQKPENVEVFTRLRFDGFVRRDDQQHQVHAAHSSQHVAHKALVPWYIYKPKLQRLAVRAGQVPVRKAQINRDPPAFFLLQSVCVNPRKRFDQRRFAVIDVPRGSDDE